MIYLIVILIMLIITFLSEKIVIKDENNKKNKYNRFLIFISIVFLSIFAAVRNVSVGVDIKTYLEPSFNAARDSSIISLMNNYSLEPIFATIIYISAKLFDNIHVCMFIIQLISLSLFYKFAIYFSKKNSISLCIYVLVYLLLCYFESFCIIRQHIALSVLLYSLTFFDQKKYKKTTLLFLIAMLLHSSSIGFLIVYILYYNCFEKESIKMSNIFTKMLLFVIIIIIYLNITKIILFLINNGILPTRYIYYIITQVFAGRGLQTVFDDGVMIFLLISSIFYSIIISSNTRNNIFAKRVMLVSVITQLFMAVLPVIRRLNILYLYLAFIFVSNDLFAKNKNTKNAFILKLIYILSLIVYFYAIIILDKCGYKVYPYYF